jgi:hypothetical protein
MEKLEGEDQVDAKRSIANVRRRLQYARILHEGGMQALNVEMFKDLDNALDETLVA